MQNSSIVNGLAENHNQSLSLRKIYIYFFFFHVQLMQGTNPLPIFFSLYGNLITDGIYFIFYSSNFDPKRTFFYFSYAKVSLLVVLQIQKIEANLLCIQ